MIFAKTGGVLTFVLTFATVVTKQKPESTLLPSRRKTSAAPPSSERKAFRTRCSYSPKFRFIFSQHFTQCEASISPCLTRSNFRSVRGFHTVPPKVLPLLRPLQPLNHRSTIAQQPLNNRLTSLSPHCDWDYREQCHCCESCITATAAAAVLLWFVVKGGCHVC